jgi:hypothetical protein
MPWVTHLSIHAGRRRKIRCTWSSDDAKVCRRCEERGSTCTPQQVPSVEAKGLSSREKIRILESKLAKLTKTVQNIESKLGSQPSGLVDVAKTDFPVAPGDIDSDSSSASDVLAEDRPSHLNSLFQNEWLTLETHRPNAHAKHRRINCRRNYSI